MTHIPSGSALANTIKSAGLFVNCMQRPTLMNRLAGPMPLQKDAEGHLRLQSSTDYPIVRCRDLSKTASDEISFDLFNIIGGKPAMGDTKIEGYGEPMTGTTDSLKINQYRKAITAGGKMTQQRTPWELDKLAKAQAESYMLRLNDQLPLVHLAGARGDAYSIEWAIPLATDADFASILINPLRAPTRNRHFMSTGSGIEQIAAGGNEITIATTDVMNTDVLDEIRMYVDGMSLPMPPVKVEGDAAAEDSPLHILLVSSEQYGSIKKSTLYRQMVAQAYTRASNAKQHPLFTGEAAMWENILIKKMPKPIRFNSGTAINWCAATTSTTETTTDLVPAAFSTTHAVDRALLLGGQALAQAFGKNVKTSNPFFWSEKWLDHDNEYEVAVGMVTGNSKIRFLVDHGSESQYTDYGVMAIDSAVALAGR